MWLAGCNTRRGVRLDISGQCFRRGQIAAICPQPQILSGITPRLFPPEALRPDAIVQQAFLMRARPKLRMFLLVIPTAIEGRDPRRLRSLV
jgi:hypothetical protein